MAYAGVVTSGWSGSGVNSVTSNSANTTGANFILVNLSWYGGTVATPTVSDSKGNTPTYGAIRTEAASQVKQQFVWFESPTVGSGHTISVSGAGAVYASIVCQAFSGAAASSILRSETGMAGTFSVTVSPGSQTPGAADDLVAAGLTFDTNGGGAISIGSSFTIGGTVAYSAGNWEGAAVAYLLPGNTSAVSPTWNTGNSSNAFAAGLAVFKAGAAGGDVTVSLTGQGSTASAGTLGVSRTTATTGAAATVSAGTVAPGTSKALSGQAGTSAAGTVAPSATRALSGSAATAAAGTVAPTRTVALSGASATASAGSVTTGSDKTVALTGQAATASAGTVAPSATRALTGAAVTVSAGTLTAGTDSSVTVALTGQSATATAGSVAPIVVIGLAGASAIARAGTIYAGEPPAIEVLAGMTAMRRLMANTEQRAPAVCTSRRTPAQSTRRRS